MTANERYVLLGLAQARSAWFRSVAQWATAAAIPADFVKCLSAEELRARLAAGRPYSGVLLDAGLPAVDRDLIDVALRSGAAPIVVRDRDNGRDWIALGAAAVLDHDFDRRDLMAALSTAPRVARADAVPGTEPAEPIAAWRGRVAMVCGAGGTGASTVATALAQGLANDSATPDDTVLLADLCRNADLGVLHDAGDVVPSIQELAEAYRTGRPSPEHVRSMTYAIPGRRYALLLGLRRTRDWAALRPRSFESAFDGLRRAFGVVVCDTDADLEGEAECGSVDVEERNLMARTAAAEADVAFAVGQPGVKGVHSLVRVVNALLAFGTPADIVVPVVNRAPRNPRQKAELANAIGSLLPTEQPVSAPIFLPERKVDEAFRDGVPLPQQLVRPIAGAWAATLDRQSHSQRPTSVPVRVTPGSLGTWAEQDEEIDA